LIEKARKTLQQIVLDGWRDPMLAIVGDQLGDVHAVPQHFADNSQQAAG
jgi:hypothetical protein